VKGAAASATGTSNRGGPSAATAASGPQHSARPATSSRGREGFLCGSGFTRLAYKTAVVKAFASLPKFNALSFSGIRGASGTGTVGAVRRMVGLTKQNTHWAAAPARLLHVLACLTLASVLVGLPGCSLISLKSPERPLSTRDLNARILTHEYASRFIAGVAQTADQITAASDDPEVRLNALRWKIGAVAASEHAASQMSPMLSVLDTWGLAVQMRDYLAVGAGQTLFGAQQPVAVGLAVNLAKEAEDVARGLSTPEEFATEQRFIEGYATQHPITTLDFARASVIDLWAQQSGTQVRLVDTLGTIPEAMSQTGDLVRMYGDTVPSQLLWKGQLAAQESGLTSADLQIALHELNERLAKLSEMANAAPGRFGDIARETRVRFDESWTELIHAIDNTGETLSSSANTERQELVKAVDAERTAATADAQRVATELIRNAGEEARRLVREAVLLAVFLALVLFGLPFAAGYYVGRARGQRRASTVHTQVP
jgi:hypothetical protein